MAFAVNFYTYAKKDRSTATPSGTGTSINCTANDPLDVLAPLISLDWTGQQGLPTSYNYARIADFGRWYRIRSWTNRGGIWEAQLVVDSLASHKQPLSTQNIYVYRSSSSYDLKIADNLYPATVQLRKLKINLSKLWTVGGANAAGTAEGVGTYVLGIISSGLQGLSGVQYYGFTAAQLAEFMDFIFSQTYFNTILTEFGAAEYPEAKVAINPLQYITSARWFPMGYSTDTKYTLIGGGTTFVAVGNQSVSDDHVWAAAFFDVPGTQLRCRTTTIIDEYPITTDLDHPQAQDRGDWLNVSPYTVVEAFIPPFGIVPIDSEDLMSADTLKVRYDIDVWTGMCSVTLITVTNNRERVILKLSAACAVDVPLSAIYTNPVSQTQLAGGALKTLTSALSLDANGVMEGIKAGAKSMIDSYVPHLSTMGDHGSTVNLSGDPAIEFTQRYMSGDDLNGRGRPLMAKRQISTIPGYIIGDPDEISIACTDRELSEIRDAVREGFYYE